MYSNIVEKTYNKLHYISLPNIFQHIWKKKGQKKKISLFPAITDGCLGTTFKK